MTRLTCTPEEQRLVDLAVADAPPLTIEQITELRRILRPEDLLLRTPPAAISTIPQARRAA